MHERNLWHSKTGSVYHNNDHCSSGHSMKVNHSMRGKGGKPLCRECAALTARGVPKIMQDWDKTPDGRIHSIAI